MRRSTFQLAFFRGPPADGAPGVRDQGAVFRASRQTGGADAGTGARVYPEATTRAGGSCSRTSCSSIDEPPSPTTSTSARRASIRRERSSVMSSWTSFRSQPSARQQAIPGFTSEPIRTNTITRAGWRSGSWTSLAASDWPVMSGPRRGAGPRGVARGRARGGGRRGGRATTSCCAGCSSSWRGRGSLTNQREAAPAGVRRWRGGRAGRSQRAAPLAAVEASVPPLRGWRLNVTGWRCCSVSGRPTWPRDLAPRPYAPPDDDAAHWHGRGICPRRRHACARRGAPTGRSVPHARGLPRPTRPRASIQGRLGFLAGRGNVFSLAQAAVGGHAGTVGTDLGAPGARSGGRDARATEQTPRRAPSRNENALIGLSRSAGRVLSG